MNKRVISLLLAVAILLGVAGVGAFSVSAESAFNTSEECISMIKAEEGFVQYPYWDYAQYTIGYGTRCPDDKFDYYSANGITEEEADVLLRSFLDAFEEDVNQDLIDKFGLTLTQNQFDALIMFSYNCGTGWIYNDSDNLRKAVVSGATGNEIIDRFTRWCNAGGQIKVFLIKRRLAEANLYLNGIYDRKVPENFGYVLYDANGGTASPNVQGYSTELTAAIIPIPTYEGHQFAGWFTERDGGTQVTVLDASVRNTRLYAHWKDSNGNDIATEDVDGVKVTVAYDDVNLRQGPGTSYPVIGTANKGEKFTITQTATADGYTWGKYYSGWICLDLTDYDPDASQETPSPEQPSEPVAPPAADPAPDSTGTVMGTVKVSDCLRVRSGPSTGYPVVGYLYNGGRVQILEQSIVGHMTWGRTATGWISMDYVVLDPSAPAPEQPAEPTPPPATEPPATQPPVTQPEVSVPTPETWTGTVKVSDLLRVRTGPGTSNAIAGYLSPNEKVVITEKQTVGGTVWGKINKGWISLDYVVLDAAQSGSTNQTVMGTVNVNEFLRIRSGPSTSYAVAGYLGPKDRVEILERKTVGGTVWGRITSGWISLDYVILDGQSSSSGQTQTAAAKTVTADCLRIRSAAGTSNSVVGYLYTGAKVDILETTTVGGTTWGRIAKGWISLDYVR